MKRILTIVFFGIFAFSVLSSILYPLPPKDCPYCWVKFNKSLNQRIMPIEKISNSKYEIGLSQLRSDLEKARIGDILSLELILGKDSVVKLGTYTPVILQKESTILEEYRGMGKVLFNLPEGMKQVPVTGVLVIKTSKGQIKSIKTVQLVNKR